MTFSGGEKKAACCKTQPEKGGKKGKRGKYFFRKTPRFALRRVSSTVVGHAETELLLTQPLRWCIPSDSIFGCRATELLLNNYQTQTKQSPPPTRKSRLAGSCSARAAALVARLAVAKQSFSPAGSNSLWVVPHPFHLHTRLTPCSAETIPAAPGKTGESLL